MVGPGRRTSRALGFLHGLRLNKPAKDVQKALLAQGHPRRHRGDPAILRLLPAFILKEEHIDLLRAALVGSLDRMKNFLDLADLSREQVVELLALAERLQQQPEPQALAGKILGLLFFNPSLRTLASLQAAMARLGGNSFVITAGQGTWQLETRRGAVMNGAPAEHVREGSAGIGPLL